MRVINPIYSIGQITVRRHDQLQELSDDDHTIYVDVAATRGAGKVRVGLAAALPGTCVAGELYYASDTKRLYIATAANTWDEYGDVLLKGSLTQGDIIYRDATRLARLAAGASGKFLKTFGAGVNPDWAEAAATYATGSFQIAAADTERFQQVATPTKKKEIGMARSGTVNVSLAMCLSTAAAQVAHARIYVNGSAVGTDRTDSSGVYQTYTEDIAVTVGDLVQGYIWEPTGARSVYIKEFRVRQLTAEVATVSLD